MKKKTTILLIVLLLSGMKTITAQPVVPYHPLVKDGKTWKCQITKRMIPEKIGDVEAFYDQTTTYSLRVGEDTIIAGKSYKKIYEEITAIDKQLIYTYPKEAAEEMEKYLHQDVGITTLYDKFLREENKKVYAHNKSTDTEYLLYDFSLLAGEKNSNEFPLGEVQISSIDTIAAQGQYFRRYHLGENGGYEPLWVEGIGHPGGPFHSANHMVNDGTLYVLLACYEDGECIFTKDDFYNPAVTSQIGVIKNAESDVTTYDLQGRRIPEGMKPQRGVYIREGKKYHFNY